MVISAKNKKAILAITITCVISWAFAFLGTSVYPSYSFGLFIWLPILIGALSTILYGYNNAASKQSCWNVAFLTLLIFCVGLLTFAFEGLICIN